MKAVLTGRLRKPILAALILLLLQLSCGSVSQTDPRIQTAVNQMAGVFDPLLRGLNLIPGGVAQLPAISQITSDSVSGSVDAIALPTEVHLYHVDLQGCGKDPLRGALLGKTTPDSTGTWTIPYSPQPGEVVATTQIINGKESELSNPKVNLDADKILIVSNADELQQTNYESLQPIEVKGSSFAGACVILQNEDPEYGRVSSFSVGSDGQWQIPTQVQDGQNRFKIFAQGWAEYSKEISIVGFAPKMQWPYSTKDSNGNYVSQVTDFFGYNDYYWFDKGKTFHDGIDISGEPSPSFVRAVADGDVFYVQISSKDWSGGYVVIIDHGAWYSVYMHLSTVTVDCTKPITADTIKDCASPSASQYFDNAIHVNAGDVIGVTGATGCPGCPVHLHFSAYRWLNADREKSLGKTRVLTWPWLGNYGARLNVNPPATQTLQIGAYVDTSTKKTYDAHTENSSDRLGYCASGSNYWDVDWQNITIKEWGPPDVKTDAAGTQFDVMGGDVQCAIEHDLSKPSK